MRRYDLTGQKIGKWKVLSFAGTDKTKSRDSIYNCECECGTKKTVKGYYLKNGYSTQCVSCGHEAQKIKGRKIPFSYWRCLKSGAKRRGIQFNLTIDKVYALLEKQGFICALSGLPINFPEIESGHLKGETTASVDRINPKLGYKMGNIQLVHKEINFMKHTLQQDRFLELCHRVVGQRIKP